MKLCQVKPQIFVDRVWSLFRQCVMHHKVELQGKKKLDCVLFLNHYFRVKHFPQWISICTNFYMLSGKCDCELSFFFYLSESNSVPVVISWQHSLHAKIMWIYDIVSFDVLAGPRWWLYSLPILHVFIRGKRQKKHFIWDGVSLQIPHLIRNKAEIFA